MWLLKWILKHCDSKENFRMFEFLRDLHILAFPYRSQFNLIFYARKSIFVFWGLGRELLFVLVYVQIANRNSSTHWRLAGLKPAALRNAANLTYLGPSLNSERGVKVGKSPLAEQPTCAIYVSSSKIYRHTFTLVHTAVYDLSKTNNSNFFSRQTFENYTVF